MRTLGGTLEKEELQNKYLQLSNGTTTVIDDLKKAIKDATGENLSASEIVNSIFTETFEFGPCPAEVIQSLIEYIKSRPTQ